MKRERTRARLAFRATFTGPVEGWAVNYIYHNAWRVPAEHGPDDLYQDAWVVFLRVADHYPGVKKPEHFMSLYQRAFINHITNLANKRTRRASWEQMLIDPSAIEEQTNALLIAPNHFEQRQVRRQIKGAPRAIKTLVKALHIDPLTLERASAAPRVKRCRGRRETSNEYFCRLVGFDPELIDFAGIIRTWVKGDVACVLQR